jgi:hypothetical protein
LLGFKFLEISMFAIIAMMVAAAIVMLVVQSEVFAMLSAVAFARKLEGTMASKIRIGCARYEWSSAFWHETSSDEPAYSIGRPLALFIATTVAATVAMDFGGVEVDGSVAVLMGEVVSLFYFAWAYGASFAAHRAVIAECQKQGTWHFA